MIDSLDDVRTVLQFVDPTCTREDWVKVGDAIKGEFGDNGFDEWDRWSQGGDNYSPHAAKTTWRSLKGVVPMGWLAKLGKEKGWQPERRELTEAEKRQRESDQAARRAQREQREKQEAALEQQWHQRVGQFCRDVLSPRFKGVGASKYLGRKKVQAFGVLFVPSGMGVLVDSDAQAISLLEGRDACQPYFDKSNRPEHVWFAYLSRGTIAIPMRDADGQLFNFQFIFAAGAKKFIKHGRKKGLNHRFGDFDSEHDFPLVVCEGYATAASCHMATGWPCAVAWDCGNLLEVALQLRTQYPGKGIIIAGDDDSETKDNPGRAKALEAAKAVQGAAVFPGFAGVPK